MSLRGTGALAMWWQMDPPIRTEFEDWHSHEHFPERMSIPGFRRGSRWAERDGEGFFVLYELEAYETLVSPGYLARLNDPTPWSKTMMPHHRNMVRSQCRVVGSYGGGIAQDMTTLRFSPNVAETGTAWRQLRSHLARLPDQPGLTGAHVLKTETPAIAQTTEQLIRGGDAAADWAVLLSGYDEAALAAAARDIRQMLLRFTDAGESAISASSYRLAFSLSCEDVAERAP